MFRLKGSRWFSREIQLWVRDGLISDTQAAELSARYELDRDSGSGRLGRILKAVAVLLAGMGLFLIISENWHRYGIPTRMSFGLLPLMLTYGLGIFYLVRKNFSTAGTWFLLSSILLGLNIFLQAQIFHLSGYLPGAFLWWMLGSVPAAVYFRTIGHNTLLQVLYFAWVCQETYYARLSPMGPPVLLISAYLLYRTGRQAMDAARDKAPSRIAVSLVAINIVYTVFALEQVISLQIIKSGWLIIIAAGLLLVFALLTAWRNSAIQLFLDRLRGLTGILLALVLLSFTHTRMVRGLVLNELSWLSGAVIALALVIVALAYFREKSRDERAAMAASFAWPLLIMICLFGLHLTASISVAVYKLASMTEAGFAFYGSICTSLLLLVCGLWLLARGIRSGAKRPFMQGIFYIVALAIMRYLEYFKDYVVAASVFILCAGLLLTLNFVWSKMYAVQDDREQFAEENHV